MLRIVEPGPGARLCDGWSRREVLRIGGFGVLGAGLDYTGLSPTSAMAGGAGFGSGSGSFGRARSCIVLFLMGGPPQHSTWDPKPDAPAEVRGDFGPIATRRARPVALRADAADGPGRRQALHPPGDVHGRQRPLVERLLHAHGPAPPADELRERQPGRAERSPGLGALLGQGRPIDAAACRPRSRCRTGSSTPTAASGPARTRASSAGRPTLAPERPADPRGLPDPGDRPARRPRHRPARASARIARPAPTRARRCRSGGIRRFDDQTRQAFDLLLSPAGRRAFRLEDEPEAEPRAVRQDAVRPERPAGPSTGRGGRPAGAGQLVSRPRRAADQPVLGQPHAGIGPAQGRARAARRTRRTRRCWRTWTSAGCWTRRWSSAWPSSAGAPGSMATAAAAHWGSVFSVALAGGGVRGGQVYGALGPDRRLSPRGPGPPRGPLGHALPLPGLCTPDRVSRPPRPPPPDQPGRGAPRDPVVSVVKPRPWCRAASSARHDRAATDGPVGREARSTDRRPGRDRSWRQGREDRRSGRAERRRAGRICR